MTGILKEASREASRKKWKEEVIKTLATAQSQIEDPERKSLLAKWFDVLETMTPQEIHAHLLKAKADPEIKKHETFLFNL